MRNDVPVFEHGLSEARDVGVLRFGSGFKRQAEFRVHAQRASGQIG